MRNLFPALAVATLLLLPAPPAKAADCTCDRSISVESCLESVEATKEEPRLPPLWCERGDDPRCMPANTHGSTVHTLVPLATGWNQPLTWGVPPRSAKSDPIWVDGGARDAHLRRVERPPR